MVKAKGWLEQNNGNLQVGVGGKREHAYKNYDGTALGAGSEIEDRKWAGCLNLVFFMRSSSEAWEA